jgi:hypothetical protein
VVLIGASSLVGATRLWELPPEERRRIHNFAIFETNHEMHFQFVRFLVERQGLLAAGGEKSLVVLYVSYHNVNPVHGPRNYFDRVWERYGLYTYGRESGIDVASKSNVERFVRGELARVAGFLDAFVAEPASFGAHKIPERVRELNPDVINRAVLEGMETSWSEKVATQISQLAEMLAYLQLREARILVILLPRPSWDDNLSFPNDYNAIVKSLCETRDVDLLDWSRFLDDDDFADYTHPNVDGSKKLHAAMHKIAVAHLHDA